MDEDQDKAVNRLAAKKLELEIQSLVTQQRRAWIITVSILIGVIGSSFTVIKTLSDVSLAYKENVYKSRMETTKMFLNDILPKIKGEGSTTSGSKGIKKGAYLISIKLANDYSELTDSVRAVLEANSKSGDTDATDALKLLNKENAE